jgi:hypothetical protein
MTVEPRARVAQGGDDGGNVSAAREHAGQHLRKRRKQRDLRELIGRCPPRERDRVVRILRRVAGRRAALDARRRRLPGERRGCGLPRFGGRLRRSGVVGMRLDAFARDRLRFVPQRDFVEAAAHRRGERRQDARHALQFGCERHDARIVEVHGERGHQLVEAVEHVRLVLEAHAQHQLADLPKRDRGAPSGSGRDHFIKRCNHSSYAPALNKA